MPRAVAPIAYPTAFFVQQPATVAKQIEPLPGDDASGCRPPTCSPGWLAAGARAGPGRGASPGPGGRDGGAGSFRRGCGLAGPGSARAGAHPSGGCLNASAGPGGMGCGGSPQGGAGAVEDPLVQGAEPLTCVVRVLMAASPSRRSTRTWIWLELNKVGVGWCDWEVLEVVVEGAVGDVGG